MPAAVNINEPPIWRNTDNAAAIHRPSCIMATVSREKEDNVVRLPKKPVINSKRHWGSATHSAQNPISKAPIQFAASVPQPKIGATGNSKPSIQRNTAPTTAPRATGKIFKKFIIKLKTNWNYLTQGRLKIKILIFPSFNRHTCLDCNQSSNRSYQR